MSYYFQSHSKAPLLESHSSLLFWHYSSTILLPNGASAKAANSKCLRAKGIPMMVMKRRNAKTICIKAVYNPPVQIQIILNNSDKHPLLLSESTTVLPNGHNTKPAILKHC